MKILSASFFLAIGMGIGTVISAVSTDTPTRAPAMATASSAADYVQLHDDDTRDALDEGAR